MAGIVTAPKFSTWSVPEGTRRIEYSSEVLEEIRQIAVEGYHAVPHGGVETGGILFGTQQKNVLRIKAWRPIACEYAKGPSFILTEKEEATLAAQLKSFREPELARMEPVGWYRSHTRSEVLLSDVDIAFFNRFFPQPWQVGLIIRPAGFAPTRAGFFFREDDGTIRAQSSYREFVLAPVALASPSDTRPEATEPSVAPPPPAPLEPTPPEPAPAEPVTARTPPLEFFKPTPPPPRPASHLKLYAAGAAILAALLAFWLLKPSQSLKLTAKDMTGQLQIAWNGAAPPISRAKSGSIDIEDHGVQTQLTLTPADLRSGSLFYERLSGDVVVRLTVDVPGGAPIVEMTRFLRPGEPLAPLPSRAKAASKPAVQTPLPAPFKPEAKRPPDTKKTADVTTESKKIPAGPSPPPPATVASSPVRHIVPFRAPESAPRQSAPDIRSLAPPTIENAPATQSSALNSVIEQPSRPPAAPVPAAVPHTSNPAPVAASGRIIWTGRLSKNGRLILDRNHASSGAIVGSLPTTAARVSAYPGDLTSAGITLFTSDPRYSQPVSEKPGAQNGWNTTTYTWDPKRAGGIRIVEQPTPQNGYKLVLQCDVPKVSVVVLDWRSTQ